MFVGRGGGEEKREKGDGQCGKAQLRRMPSHPHAGGGDTQSICPMCAGGRGKGWEREDPTHARTQEGARSHATNEECPTTHRGRPFTEPCTHNTCYHAPEPTVPRSAAALVDSDCGHQRCARSTCRYGRSPMARSSSGAQCHWAGGGRVCGEGEGAHNGKCMTATTSAGHGSTHTRKRRCVPRPQAPQQAGVGQKGEERRHQGRPQHVQCTPVSEPPHSNVLVGVLVEGTLGLADGVQPLGPNHLTRKVLAHFHCHRGEDSGVWRGEGVGVGRGIAAPRAHGAGQRSEKNPATTVSTTRAVTNSTNSTNNRLGWRWAATAKAPHAPGPVPDQCLHRAHPMAPT
jgi:hypothetical protein